MKVAAMFFAALAVCAAQEVVVKPSTTDIQKVVDKMRRQGRWRAAYVIGEKSYRLLYVPSVNGKPSRLSFWVRPLGEAGNEHLDFFSDTGKDGIVDSGFTGTHHQKWFKMGVPNKELQLYWQWYYKDAVEAILKLPD